MAIADTVQIPGTPPLGAEGIQSQYLREQVIFNQQLYNALVSLESSIILLRGQQ